jgi:hypothetical protein
MHPKFFLGNVSMRRPRVKPGNIKRDLKEIVCDDIDWIHLSRGGFQWWNLLKMSTNIQKNY